MDYWQYILIGVDGDSDLPAIFLGIVVAYLTILISVAIAIFSEKKEFEALDRNVILDHIIKAKYLLIYLGFTFIPLLFWNGSLLWTRLISIFFWIIGVFFLTKILFNAYHWMKGNKFRLRFNYLRRLTDRQDIEETWRSVWETESINSQNEQEFFSIFQTTVNQLLKKTRDDLIIASKLLDDFNNFFDKRDTAFFTWSDETFDSILEWHFEMWKKQQEKLSPNDKLDERSIYRNLLRTVNSIFQKIEIQALTESISYPFFENLKKHAEKYKIESVSSKSYLKFLFNSFYQIFFKNIYDAPDRFDIWDHYFPEEWKITKSNLQNSENIISKNSLENFWNWAIRKIGKASEEKDFPLDDISRNLFPDVDPTLWAKILIFVFSSHGENRLCSVIERPWNFGFMNRVKIYRYSQETELKEMYEDEEINTFDLSYYLFKDQFSKINLENYIESLEQISYPERSKEEDKKLRLHYLFTKMLVFVKGN